MNQDVFEIGNQTELVYIHAKGEITRTMNETEIEATADSQDEEMAPSTVEGGTWEVLKSIYGRKITRTKRWEKSKEQSKQGG